MSRHIWLALSEPKCAGSMCKHPTPCARRDIPADKGRPLVDFSRPMNYVAECCAPRWYRHLPYSAAVKPDQEAQVRDWIGHD